MTQTSAHLSIAAPHPPHHSHPPQAMSTPSPPRLDYAFTLSVSLSPPTDHGVIPHGHLRYIPITGGTVTGPKLVGTVLAGGGDWNTVRGDGIGELRAEYSIRVRVPDEGRDAVGSGSKSGSENGSEDAGAGVSSGSGGSVESTVYVRNEGIGWRGRGGVDGFSARTWPRFEVEVGSPVRWLAERFWMGVLRTVEEGGVGVVIDIFEVL